MLCPACGDDRSVCTDIRFSHRNHLPWHRCISCGSFFDSAAFDSEDETLHHRTNYSTQNLGLKLGEFKAPLYETIIKLLKKNCPPPATLLDVGCSYGGFLLRARQEGYNVYGADIDPQAIDYVKNLGIGALSCSSIADMKLVENGSVNIVTCIDCNCYWSEQPSELSHAFQKLRPGGYLAMRVVDKSWMCWLGLTIKKMAPNFSRKVLIEAVNDHRFSMPVKSLLKVIQLTGFEVIHASPRGAIHSPRTRWTTRASFTIGSLLWTLSGVFVAPGALVLAKKPNNKAVPLPRSAALSSSRQQDKIGGR